MTLGGLVLVVDDAFDSDDVNFLGALIRSIIRIMAVVKPSAIKFVLNKLSGVDVMVLIKVLVLPPRSPRSDILIAVLLFLIFLLFISTLL